MGLAEEEGEREARAEGAGEQVRRRDALEALADHGARSQVDERPELLEAGRPDPGHRVQLVHGAEGAVRRPVVDDLLRGHRAHAGQLVELLERRRVEVDLAARRHPARAH